MHRAWHDIAVGVWTWLDRYASLPDAIFDARVPRDDREALLSEIWTGADPAIRAVEQIHTHRVWHALHVGLTGSEMGGDAPAFYVLGGDDPSAPMPWTDLAIAHPPERVKEIADYLAGLTQDAVVARLYETIARLELYVYSFERWDGELDMVQCGSFAEVFERLRRFYRDAADAHNVVSLHRG